MQDNAFIEILNKLIVVYGKLIETSRSKREALVSADREAVDAANKQEEKLIWQGGKIDSERLKWLHKFSVDNKLSSTEPTIMQVAQLYDDNTATAIKATAGKLRDILKDLDVINRQNANLLFKALRMIEFNINVLTTATANGGQTYGNKNNQLVTNPNKQGVLDARG